MFGQRKNFPGNHKVLTPGTLVEYFIQQHNAKRRGPHYDFRLGTKDTGLLSWATQNHPLKVHEGDRQSAARTNVHRYSYGKWEGHIPPGYGHGDVKLDSHGKALITRTTDNTVSFSIGDGKYPKRFTLVNPGEKYGKGFWILLRQKLKDKVEAEKTKYKTVDPKDVPELLKTIPSDTVVQPKIDGALQFLSFGKNKVELTSHRLSEVNGKPIIHTERVFGTRPHLDIPKKLRHSVFLTEIYGTRDGKVIPQQETSGILNSSLTKALEDQKEKNIKLNGMIFGVAKIRNKDVNFDTPYEERKKLIEDALKLLPPDQFHSPEEAQGAKKALDLWNKIRSMKHEHTEGIVLHPKKGVPTKIKVTPEQDVYIRSFFKGEGKYSDKGVGGFYYSHKPKGNIVGKVGTGFNDNLRKLMLEDPEQFIGIKARVRSQGQLPSGALRAPSLINIHEG